jgi:hypothetical protein
MERKKHSKDFGEKEFLLNYVNRRWGLTKTSKVGEVMALIRECQPTSFKEWEEWYFKNAYTKTKTPIKMTREILRELGERLYAKLKEIVIPEITNAIKNLTPEDCLDYIYQLTICRTYDGFLEEKSVVNDVLAKKFPSVKFEESNPQLDHAGDIDYIGKIGDKAFGIQIKPLTVNANLGNYDVSARMQQSFRAFEEQYGGKVFIVLSVDGEIANKEIIEQIEKEIKRLQ